MAGIGLWYVSGQLSRARTVLVVAVIAVVSIPGMGLFPGSWYHDVYIHYALKTLPVALMWCVIEADLLTWKQEHGQPDSPALNGRVRGMLEPAPRVRA
jgi:hypothetical protein